VVSVFGGLTEYGAASTVWTLDSNWIMTTDGLEHDSAYFKLCALTEEASLNVTIDIYSKGRKDSSDTGRTLTITNARLNYIKGDCDLNLRGNAWRFVLTYTGSTPPTIFPPTGIILDDTPVEI
jgi:hypothetical protein